MLRNDIPVLYIIIPCYNEKEVLPITANLFLDELRLLIEKKKIFQESRILFCNDGSKDSTWEIITNGSERKMWLLFLF